MARRACHFVIKERIIPLKSQLEFDLNGGFIIIPSKNETNENRKGRNMLSLKNISFETDEGKKILDNVTLDIDDRFVAITGPNGGGKSTLAKIIAGIYTPTSGQIFFNGEDITGLSITERANKGISYAFQQPVRFKGLSVKDLLTISAGEGTSLNDCCDLLSEVGLCAREYVNRELDDSLSGGEIKRIEIASVLARKKELNVFDEPEAGIDLWSFNNLIHVFEKMSQKTSGSIIIISHQERILDIADKIIYLKDGKVEKYGKKDEILPELLNASATTCKVLTDKM